MADCLFCRIIRGEVPSKKVYEDEHTFAFEDLNPQGPTHVLVVPKKHISGLKEAAAEDAELVGRCHLAAAHIARQRSIEDGYFRSFSTCRGAPDVPERRLARAHGGRWGNPGAGGWSGPASAGVTR